MQVTAGQELSGQDFRERGLRPEYVYNRLFSTPVMPVGSTNWISSVRRIVGDADEAASETSSLPVIPSAQNPVSILQRYAGEAKRRPARLRLPSLVAASQPAKVYHGDGGAAATQERLHQSGPELLATTFERTGSQLPRNSG